MTTPRSQRRRAGVPAHSIAGTAMLWTGLVLCAGPVGAQDYAFATPVPPNAAVIWPGEDVQQRVDAEGSGTSFLFLPGVYRNVTIRPKDGDSFFGEPGAILSGARTLTGFAPAGDYWALGGQGRAARWNGQCRTGVARCGYSEQLFLNGQLLLHAGSLAEVTSGTWYLDYDAGTVYMYDDPSGQTVEMSVTRRAFAPTGDNVTISGLTIERYANGAQMGAIDASGRSGWQVAANELRGNHGAGIIIGSASEFRGNFVHDNGQLGIAGGGTDAVVEANEIASNNTAGFDPAWEAGGTKFVGTVRLAVRGNFVHHNGGPGLWTDTDNLDTIYENNTVDANDWMGIFHETGQAAIIRNNTIRWNGYGNADYIWGAGILIAASPNVEVAGNVLDANADGIAGIQQARGSGSYGPHELWNLWVHDNTIMNTEGWTGVVEDVGDASVFTSRNILFDGNTYQHDGAFVWMNGECSADEWRAYGQDVNGSIEP